MYSVTAIFLSFVMLLAAAFGQALPLERLMPDQSPVSRGETRELPLFGGCDPWFYQYDGVYYHCYSVGNGVAVRAARDIAALADAEGQVVYRAPRGTAYSENWWAPELHCINGRWYIYVAADDGENANHRMYVLSCDTPTGQFVMEGKIADPNDKWAIDGTVLNKDGSLWFIWSGWEGDTDEGQNLYIAPMDSPTHISGPRALLSVPDKKWEKNGHAINEGPEVLQRDGHVYVVYSASGSWTDDYCLGMLRLAGGDPMNAKNWAKCPNPVFKAVDTAYGPGHCSFVTSVDGNTDYIVYHANVNSGTGWSDRSVRVQRFFWLGGVPVFGKPLPAGSTVVLK